MGNPPSDALSIGQIRAAVAIVFDVTAADIASARRDRRYALPRQVVMYLARELTQNGLPQIGRVLGRDHTTVFHGHRAISERIKDDDNLRGKIDMLRSALDPSADDLLRALWETGRSMSFEAFKNGVVRAVKKMEAYRK